MGFPFPLGISFPRSSLEGKESGRKGQEMRGVREEGKERR